MLQKSIQLSKGSPMCYLDIVGIEAHTMFLEGQSLRWMLTKDKPNFAN
jgi:hypothetical protein